MNGAVFIDTNVFLRVLLDDHSVHSPAARRVFEAIDNGELEAWTSHVAFSELVWVLTGPLKRLPRAEVAAGLLRILQWPRLHVSEQDVLKRGLELFVRHPIDWIDAYHAAVLESRGEAELLSFDDDFDKVPGLRRVDPSTRRS